MKPSHSKAQAMVEFALVFPLLLVVIYGIFELGRLIFIYSSVTTSSREGARYGSAAGDVGNFVPHYLDCAGIITAAQRAAILQGVAAENINISYDKGPGTAVYSNVCPPSSETNVELGDRVIVRVTIDYAPIMPLVNFSSFPITAVSSRTIMKNIEIKGTPPPVGGGVPAVFFSTDSQSVDELDEPSVTQRVVSLQLSYPAVNDVTVPLIVSGSATSGADFTISTTSVNIPAGGSGASLTVDIIGDSLDEADETVVLSIGAPTNATVGSPSVHTITIIDDDDPPMVSFDLPSQQRSEDTNMVFSAVLSHLSGRDVIVPFIVTGGTAQGGGIDYSLTNSPVVIPAGSLSAVITIFVNDDLLDELDEQVNIAMGTPTNAVPGTITTHQATILDNDMPPVVSFELDSQSGGEDVGEMSVRMILSNPSTFDITVPFDVSGTATENEDYTISTNSSNPHEAFIPAGSLDSVIAVTLIQDGIPEEDETIILTMGTPVNATRGVPYVHTITILTASGLPIVNFQVASQSVLENVGSATVRIVLSNAWSQPVVVPFTVGGTATQGAGNDYTITASPVTIPAGSVIADVVILVNNDSMDEPDETVVLTMGNPTNGVKGTTSVHTLTIIDNDNMPSVTFTTAEQDVDESSGTVNVEVQLSAPSSFIVSVPFSVGGTAQGTAGQGQDYTISSSPLQIPAGTTQANIVINVIDDTEFGEQNETIILTMGTPTNAVLGAQTDQTITIIENDICPSVGSLPVPNGTKLSLTVSNVMPNTTFSIESIVFNWADIPVQQKLRQVSFGSNTIWDAIDNTPVSDLPREGGWSGFASYRDLPPLTAYILQFETNDDLQMSSMDYVLIRFNIGSTNVCTVQASR